MPVIVHSLRLGPLDNGVYVLADADTREAAVVDVGFEPEVVLDLIERERLTISRLLLTHGHFDHVCGMRAIQLRHPAPCWVHPADRPLVAALAEQTAAFGFPPADPPVDQHDLADGQKLSLGANVLEVIHTPGHSPGGVCFRAGDDLLVGDTLFAGSIGRTDIPGGSFEQLEHSIRTRLFPLGDALRCHPGHGPATTLGAERRGNPFVGDGAVSR
jgi:glyoxylase-like metal-dependent hydrolase (beta-lactamase superfamily II)